ncbi:hypothetical protein TorRG33x02_002450 [Trema orientale]|uniref:Tetraspanin/Peripherin n=1 Tax=Trema orientale TaxID=63057 RepID=A0A2P5G1P8_TREOI|nr:hypothetical protein TorRG33x02_002450 [Trema orientale]
MVRCGRYCLYKSMRATNLLVNLCGVAMIIYSLWLLKKWKLGVSHLPIVLYLPKPWFAYACLGVGIAVCLSTLFGHIVANSSSDSILCIYIYSICTLFLLQVAVVVTIFFKINWDLQLSKFIDEHHKEFKSFVMFQIRMCRLIVIIALVPEINVIVLAIILWGVGTDPLPRSIHPSHLDILDFRQSFLEVPNSPMPENAISSQILRNPILSNYTPRPRQYQYPRQSYLSYLFGVFGMSFLASPRVNTV